ncbi:balbiani ring protein 3-like [Actinia tenebrosa]|uniref:Balbiani ring protein 3-like n=1 Tax=Actinia tenebrosa TaxID=6105 RepID=A0A6P8HXY5_ACTTE|nr:balbiani ring protein 3-like [Actinia tenebrosa]XP_031560233.1 balbiani ring protein 3-like [Actinia tenebrosa]
MCIDLKMSEKTFFIGLIFIVVTLEQVSNDLYEPVFCGPPKPLIFPIDHPDYTYWPFFVTLHRCGGSCSLISPRIQRCGPSGVDTISRSVFDLAVGRYKTMELKNHTSCNCSCALDSGSCTALEKWDPNSCRCICNIPDGEPYVCPTNYIWKQYLCKCVCNLPPKVCPVDKVWSPDQCSCVCSNDALKKCATQSQLIDKETCSCKNLPPGIAGRNTKGVPRGVLMWCMVAELVLLLILFDIFLYCKFQTGIVTYLWHKCRAKERQDVEVALRNENGSPKQDLKTDESPGC